MRKLRNWYNSKATAKTRQRLSNWYHYWTAVGVIPRWQLVFIYGMIALICTYGFIKVNQAISDIQQNRIEQCQAGNDRHDATIRQLNKEIAADPPARRREAEANKAATIRLLNAAVPKKNCEAVLK